jgi:hypothetical protein
LEKEQSFVDAQVIQAESGVIRRNHLVTER